MQTTVTRRARWWQRRCHAHDGTARCVWRRHHPSPHASAAGPVWLWRVQYGQFPGWELA